MKEINFKLIKIEFVIPLFAGVLFSLFLCSFISYRYDLYYDFSNTARHRQLLLDEDLSFIFSGNEEFDDPVLEYFRNPAYRYWVIDFFTALCSNYEIANAVLLNCETFNVSPALAFALAWEESRFNPGAVNRYNRDGSIDRGLFQLNNRSFPNLDIQSFFNINTNVYYGISHLRHCMDIGGTEVSALAMYNAGAGRVRTTGAPQVTLNYISRILNNKSRIESLFHARLIKEEESRLNR